MLIRAGHIIDDVGRKLRLSRRDVACLQAMRATHEKEVFCCSIAGHGHVVPASRLMLLLRSYQKPRCAGTCATVVQAYTSRPSQQSTVVLP